MGRGQLRKITSNTADTLHWDLPLVLDATSQIIVESPTWAYKSDITQVDNSNPQTPVTLTLPASNLLDEVLIVSGFTINADGVESVDCDQMVREAWIYGSQATRIIGADTTVILTDGCIQCDTTLGNVTVTFPSADTMLNQSVLIQKISSDANTVTVIGPAGGYTLSSQWSYIIIRSSI